MIERRVYLAVWLSLAGALAASCGGSSVSHVEDADDDGASGGTSGTAGENGGASTTGGTSTTGGAITTGGSGAFGGSGASSGGLSGAAGAARGGSGGVSGSGGEGGAPSCPDELGPGECDGELLGNWIATDCSLPVSGVVDLTGLGFSPECSAAPVTGSLRVTGSLTFEEMLYSDDTITTGESTFELPPACLWISGTETTCGLLDTPLQSFFGYDSVTCSPNAATEGCTCTGIVDQTGGLGFVSYDPSTRGTYSSAGNQVTLSAFEGDTEYASCVSQDAQVLNLSLVSVAKTGAVTAPIAFVKR